MSSRYTRQRESSGSQTKGRLVAVVDPGSSVLPFDYYFCRSHISNGARVTLLASETSYNAEFLSELANQDGADVRLWRISSTVANRVRGVLNYLRLLIFLIVNAHRFDLVYYNFPRNWVLEAALFWALGSKAVFCIHNAVPHESSARRHFGTSVLASCAHQLLFVSHWTRRDFLSRYGSEYDEKSSIVQHGVMGIDPQDEPQAYQLYEGFLGVAFWGNIKPYKGIELFRIEPEAWLPQNVGHRYLIAGKWDAKVSHLKADYQARSEIELRDGFLCREAVKSLLAQNFVFVLPYRRASQSGILYTLLFYGRYFLATDQGDVGEFLRANGLDELLIADFSADELRRAMNWLVGNLTYVQAKLSAAQGAYTWQISAKAHPEYLTRMR